MTDPSVYYDGEEYEHYRQELIREIEVLGWSSHTSERRITLMEKVKLWDAIHGYTGWDTDER